MKEDPTDRQIEEANSRVQKRKTRGSQWARDACLFRRAYIASQKKLAEVEKVFWYSEIAILKYEE